VLSGVHDRSGDRASALLLMPAATLIVLLLGAVAFDLSVVLLRQRQAHNLAAAAANDAATAALDLDRLRADGSYELVDSVADRVTRAVVARSDIAEDVIAVDTQARGDTVAVALRVRADYVFARGLPGGWRHVDLVVRATAVADPR
jgi:hypothetical protein